MHPLTVLPLLILPFALGSGLVALLGIRRSTDALGWLGWSWAAGALGTGTVLFGWALVRAPWEPVPLCALLLFAAVALHLLARRCPPAAPDAERSRRWRERPRLARLAFHVALAVALLSQADRISIASLTPILGADEARIWAAPAKLLFALPGYAPDYGALVERSLAVTHPEYPQLNPLLQVLAFTLAGETTHFLNRLPIQVFLLATLFVLAAGLRRRVDPWIGAVLLLLVAAVPGAGELELAASAYADGMCALGLLVALEAWMRFEEERTPRWPWLAALGLALAAASKNEGLLFALVFTPLAALRLARLRAWGTVRAPRAAAWAALAFAPSLATAWLNAHHGFQSDLLTDRNPLREPVWTLAFRQLHERGATVAERVWREVVIAPDETRLLFLVFLVLVLLAADRALRGTIVVATLTLAALFTGFYLVFVASPFDLDWHFRLAGVRVFSQLLPSTALWIGVVLADCGASRSTRTPRPASHAS